MGSVEWTLRNEKTHDFVLCFAVGRSLYWLQDPTQSRRGECRRGGGRKPCATSMSRRLLLLRLGLPHRLRLLPLDRVLPLRLQPLLKVHQPIFIFLLLIN